MDQMTPVHIAEAGGRGGGPLRLAARISGIALVPAALVGAVLVGMQAGEARWPLPSWVPAPVSTLLVQDQAGPEADAPVLYYRDPAGKAAYALVPSKTPDGRDYRPVRVGEDVGPDLDDDGRSPGDDVPANRIDHDPPPRRDHLDTGV